MDLGTYLSERRLTLDAFGRSVGYSAVSVHRWVTRKSRPGWPAVAVIERETGGAVTAADFVPRCEPSVPAEAGAD